MNIRDEFQLSRFGVRDSSKERFLTSHWRTPGYLYVLYRLVVAGYTLVILFKGISHYEQNKGDKMMSEVWGAYLTNWTYVLVTVYFTFHALVVIGVYCHCPGAKIKFLTRMDFSEHKYMFRELYVNSNGYQHSALGTDDDPMDIVDTSETNNTRHVEPEVAFVGNDPLEIIESSNGVPWYLSLLWILYSSASVFAAVVSIMFWTALAPMISESSLISLDNIQFHLINTLLILLEHCISAIPVRLYHIVYPFTYGMAYCMFSAVYWAEDHSHVMYPILDWGDKPGLAAGVTVIVGFVVVPLLQLFFYGVYRFKLYLFRRVCWH